ncbi:bifunctional 5-dehydro-2-deoxygluconokinase/5-dehydro-2-deoxyphosphogluconate aldolase [Pinirhizobacter soli]|uniref:bifunctional 5-dehydro-2-deoxygluconokinase/5-dehydro-2- deoxyphosphogluconate aldolase n=1 Tax=Pinirhizobacter soli TaxID=2786953 RepID=UPI00202AB774|nr:5-dehydro-2-deoxygluconokinase [Pinirhizobacter soli]
MLQTPTAAPRDFDVACLGRLAVDLYAQQIGAPLEDATSFARYLGGSSANIAFGSARLGLRSAMISRVGDDHMGRFLTRALQAEGCDTSQVSRDPERLTALAMLGIEDRETFPLLFYRENCADMALDEQDIDEAFIARCRALVITGTHFSTPRVHAASTRAIAAARRNDVRTVLDIDYRPVLWGLTGRGNGQQRFIAAAHVTEHLQSILPGFDVLVGTEEEFHIAGGSTDLIHALRAVRAVTPALLVVKRGPMGCSLVEGDVPGDIDDAPTWRGERVEVLNVLGAGDAFLSGFLAGWLGDGNLDRACTLANACGALVVSRHGCAPAMPTRAELAHFLDAATRPERPDRDDVLQHLHRVSVSRKPWPDLHVFAFDHRTQFFELAREVGVDDSRVPRLKQLLVQAVATVERRQGLEGRIGVLIDDRYGQDALNDATGRGWWVGRPVELPGSMPLEFEHGRSVGTDLVSWPREQVIKCLVQFNPDAPAEERVEQETQLLSLWRAACASGHELLLEVIPPAGGVDRVLRAMKRIYNLGIRPEWWKLCSAQPMPWKHIDALIAERDPYCRGVLLLGLNASFDQLRESFREAATADSCRGFAVGRTLFMEPARAWLAGEIGDAALIEGAALAFERMIGIWREAREPARVSA